MEKKEFSQMFYETSFDSTATAEEAVSKLSPIRDWIKSNVPQRLFRYRRVNDYSLSALQNDEIWGSTILEFNDPYECTPCYDAKKFTEHLRQMFSPDAIKQIISLVKTDRIPTAYLGLIPKDLHTNECICCVIRKKDRRIRICLFFFIFCSFS